MSVIDKCSSYKLGKIARVPLASVEHTSSFPFQIIHSDVWGPSPVLLSSGSRYFVLFIHDFTRYTWIYFLKNKNNVFQVFLDFESYVNCQFNTSIQDFHSDWGDEFQKLNKYFTREGTVHRILCPYMHKQNGLSERKI